MAPGSSTRLPDGVYNSYRQYKRNCQVIAQWVHVTATRVRAASRTRHTSTPSSQRPKGRKGSRNHNQTPVDEDLSSPKMTFRVFIKLVREITSSDVVIPTSYLALLAVTIRQRKATAAFYSSDAEAWRTNESHRRAIEIYQEALDILEHACQERSGPVSALGANLTVTLGDQDIFSLSEAMHSLAVAVEEESLGGSESTRDASSSHNEWIRDNPLLNPTSGKKTKANIFPLEAYDVVEDEAPKVMKDTKDEAFLSLSCFVLDIDRLRKYCATVWKTVVPVGSTSRITASFVTNHAVYLMKQLEYDLLTDFPQFKDVQQTQAMLLAKLFELLPGKTLETVYDVKDQLMTHVWQTLSSFADVIKVNAMPLMRDGFFGYFNPEAHRQSMSPTEKYREDQCILFNYWPDLVAMYQLNKAGEFLGDYGLPLEFKNLIKDPSRPKSWTLLFCCQIMLDTVHARRHFLQVDITAMRGLAQRYCDEIDKFTSSGITYGDNSKDIVSLLPSVRARIHHWLGEDNLTDAKVKNKWDKLSKQSCQPDSLWLMNPWLTANAITDASVEFFHAGVGIMGAGGFVQSAMHLWNMLRQTGHLPQAQEYGNDAVIDLRDKTTCKDHVLLMDHLIDVFGDAAFQGAPPKDKFLTRFELMLGVRPEAFARGKRERKKTAQTPLRYQAYNEAGRGVIPTISDAWSLHQSKYVVQAKLAAKVSPSQYPLANIQRLIESELGQGETDDVRGPLFNLNLFKIHSLCGRLFKEMNELLCPDFERVFKIRHDELIPTPTQWPMITGWIARSGELYNTGIDQQLLRKAGEIVQRILGTKETAFYVIVEDTDG